jgi:hypothetical protein
MPLRPETTLAEIAQDEQLQRELAELVMGNGVRGAMWAARLSYDRADQVATGVRAGVRIGLERLVEVPA